MRRHAAVAGGEEEFVPFSCAERQEHPYETDPARREAHSTSTPWPRRAAVEASALVADGMALELRAALERTAVPLARAAAAFVRVRGWCAFGYARAADHARERFGRSGRWLTDLAALGEALGAMPDLAAALAGDDGGAPIGRAAASIVARVARPESFRHWVARARCLTVRELREEAARPCAAGGIPVRPSSNSPAPARSTVAPPGPGEAPDDPAAADRAVVSLPVPHAVRAAFDEGLALHRAVEGREATVASFVEALVAECFASAPAPEGEGSVDLSCSAVRVGPRSSLVEAALARSTGGWVDLPPPRVAPPAVPSARAASAPTASTSRVVFPAFGAAARALRRLSSLSENAASGSERDLDLRIRSLIAVEDEIETRLGDLLAGMSGRGAWGRLRFAGIGHYAEERLGLSRTSAEDRARAARALRRYRHLRRAHRSGRIGLEAVLLVARVLDDAPAGAPGVRTRDGRSHNGRALQPRPPRDRADSDRESLERAWVERAAESTVKRLRDELRALGLRRSTGQPRCMPLADADWQASIRRDRGTARERIDRLGRSALGHVAPEAAAPGGAIRPDTPGGVTVPDPGTCVPSSPDVFLRLRLAAFLAADFASAIEARRRVLEADAASIPWDEPWPDPDAVASVIAARTFSIRCRRTPSWVGLLALLQDYAAVWDAPDGKRGRAQEAVFVRDGWRCTAPGCTSRRNLEDHHLVYRSRGGSDDESNRATLCRFHHQRGEHGGLASCSGTAPLGVVWRLGCDGIGGRFLNERRLPSGSPGGASPGAPGGEAARAR